MQRLKTGKGWQKRQKPVQEKWITGFIALLFIGAGTALGNVGQRYGEMKAEEAKAAAWSAKQEEKALAESAADEPDTPEETTQAVTETEKETETLPPPYQPAADKLNLAYFFPKDAESEEIIDSYAGEVFQELMVMDLDWLSSLYELSDISPSTMASRLGKGTKAIMGGYNPRDKAHRANNPSSWVIHDWKKIHVNFIDGDGKAIDGFSNVKDILSMASVYTYYTEMMDVDAFAEYSRQLWKNSHSYSLSMGDLYYCSGCLNKTEEELVREAEEEEFAAEQQPLIASGFIREGGVSGVVQGSAETSPVLESSSGAESLAQPSAETSPSVPETSESPTSAAETVPETSMAGSGETAASNPTESSWGAEASGSAENSSAAEVLNPVNDSQAAETESIAGSSGVSGMIVGNNSADGWASPSNLQGTEEHPRNGTEKTGKKTQYDCPGHVDLYIRVKVLGLKEKKGLFSISKAAEKKKWDGWNARNMASVNKISGKDWFEDYGLSISSISLSVPLTNQEIDEYMNHLPADTSVTRRNIIHFALSSVGRVPYYWGGKPAAPGYEGNNFGALTPADAKGRLLRGLDCSGWINWVYWSATGKRLPGESTSSLCLCGKQVSRSELKPGDIIVRTGAGAHVVMFLGWTADGRMNVIHETSGSVNNVSVAAIGAPPWPYYRKLVE